MITLGKYPAIKVKSEYACFIKFVKFSQEFVDKVKSLPTRYYEPNNKVWEVPISDLDRVVYTFGADNISVFNDFPEAIEYLEKLKNKNNTEKRSVEELIEYYKNIKCEIDYEFKTKPDGHQIEAFNIGLHRNNMIITDVMGLGKALKYGTRVITPNGYVKIEDLKVGDEVFSIEGTSTKVTAVYDHVQKEGYKVTFSDGQEVVCCEDHLWEVCQNGKYDKVIRDTKTLSKLKLINNIDNRGWKNGYRRWVPLCKPVQFNYKPVKIEPYLLGLLLGDGGLTNKNIGMCINNQDIDFVRSYLDSLNLEYTVRDSQPNASDIFFIKDSRKELNLAIDFYNLRHKSIDKFIPEDYLYNSIEVRLALLQGLLDSDGYTPNNNLIQLCLSSIKLAEQSAFLAESLGSVVHKSYHKTGYKKDGVYIPCNDALTITIRHEDPKMLVRFPRRLKNLRNRVSSPKRSFASVIPVGKIDCRCITVDHPRSLYLIEGFIATHNTKSAIDIMDYKIKTGQVKHVLVICGVNGLKYNWQGEIAKHSWYNCQVIDGSKKKRAEKLQAYWMFAYSIINIESLRNNEVIDKKTRKVTKENTNEILIMLSKMCQLGKFDAIIIDEFHKANNHKSQQGKGLRDLKSKYKMALSGTPITKKLERSWSMLNWMDFETASYWKFIQRYCNLGGFSGWDVVGYQNLDEFHERFDKVQLRRTKDILQLPPKTYQEVYVEMDSEQRKQYNLIKQGIISESNEIKLVNPAVATIKLRQFTDQIKVKAIKDLIEDLQENEEPCIVFSCFKNGLYSLQDELRDHNPLLLTGDITKAEEKQMIVDDFQNHARSNVIMGTIQAMGTGYTLTRSQYVIMMNKVWAPTDNEQAVDRAHRRGTKGNVTILSVIVKDSIDERVEEILKNDQMYIDKVVDGVPLFKTNNKDLFDFLMKE